jgi:hypothetical protein
MAIAKLIKSSAGRVSNPAGKWYTYSQIKPFIQGIETGKIDISQASSILISSVPTPWARPKLYWFAFDYIQRKDANIQTSGLIEFYKILVEEWKGLIALLALYPDRISFSNPVYMNYLNYSGEVMFDLASAFGRMLMEDTDLWTNQLAKKSNPDELPFIQLIKYNNQVIGGISPFTVVFTGVDYSKIEGANDIAWFRNGKLEDPTSILDRDKFQKLYLFIRNINQNFIEFERNLNIGREKNKIDISGVMQFLRGWQGEIELKEKGLEEKGTVAKYANLQMPYKALLASEQKVYQRKDGTLTFTEPGGNELKVEISDLQTLLKDDKKILGWYESGDKNNPLSKAAVYLLRVIDASEPNEEDQFKYFALPLSMFGIRMLNKDLGTLLSQRNRNFNIAGRINEHRNLIVDLTIEIDGRPQKLNSKEYKIEWVTQNNKVIIWPDFISDNWDAYYLYSEFPSNVQGVKYVPFFKECQKKDENGALLDTQSFITIKRNVGAGIKESTVFSTSDVQDINDSGLAITNLITYPVGHVSQDMHKYEIIKSNKPIAGLEIRDESTGNAQILGYLVVKNPNDDTMGKRKIIDLTAENINNQAIVGIDFGSNNSCVHYKTVNTGVKPVLFKNRRLALVGIDSERSGIAERDELLFFSNESTINGQVKSWLHEHDWNYVGPNRDKEIAGGVPVNEKNILVREMDKLKITTQAGILHYNMKWLSDTLGLSKKTAFLKALWLCVCADLYSEKCIPVELRWSFPGSMSSTDYTQYNTIYNVQLPLTTPILNPQTTPKTRIKPTSIIDQTEAEAVCKFALSQNYGLNSNNLFLGIDVGGSTSDILILAQDINSDNEAKLFKQSSVRIAAGVFFDAITNSASFRKAIFDYHQQQKKIKVENIREIQSAGHKAPFYLNNVFDQLTEDDFALFYTYIGKEASFVFALPAYVTGLLLFYAGKLIAKAIKENNLTTIRDIHLLPYGKGGRLFHWLQTFPGSSLTNAYFEDCFRAGFGEGAEAYSFRYRNDILADNKSEVSKGLAVENKLIYDRKIRFESDIFAEKNIKYLKDGQYIEFKEDDIISNEYFENVRKFEFPDKLENFEKFLNIFIEFIGHKTGLVRNIASLENRGKELRDLLGSFIENDPEYKKACSDKLITSKFEFRFPIFIAEGLCYLEKVLIPEIFKS